MGTNLKIKIHNFIRKYKRWIFVILIAWGLVVVINYIIENHDFKETPSTTYEPHTPIMGGNTDVNERTEESISNIIDEFVKYCNEKEYEKAYALLSTDCKENVYPRIETFEEYVDRLFPTKKVYTIQNYYNSDNDYVYRLRIFDDILATGLTGEEDLSYVTEIITLKVEQGDLVLSVNGYIGKDILESVYEDKYIKITVKSREKTYETETYEVLFSNKTEYRIAVIDQNPMNEILLKLNIGKRNVKGFSNSNLILAPGESRTVYFNFSRYYHETDLPKGLEFNNIKVLRTYPPVYDENGDVVDAIDQYGIELNFEK